MVLPCLTESHPLIPHSVDYYINDCKQYYLCQMRLSGLCQTVGHQAKTLQRDGCDGWIHLALANVTPELYTTLVAG